MKNIILLLAVTLLGVIVECGSNIEGAKSKKKIHVGALIPFMDTHDEYCFYSAMSVATEMINKDERILKDYELVIHYFDSTTLLGFAMISYFKFLNLNVTIQALIGPAFSYSTRVIALFTTRSKLPQITYAALSQLDDSEEIADSSQSFPYFMRTTPSLESYWRAHHLLLKRFHWKRVAILYDYQRVQFFTSANVLSTFLEEQGIKTVAFQGFSESFLSVDAQFQAIKDSDAKIIFGIFGYRGARRMFCEAYMRGMRHPEYQFIILNQLDNQWFQDVKWQEQGNCTQTEYVNTAHGALMLARSHSRRDGVKAVAGTLSDETWNLIEQRKGRIWSDYWLDRNPNKTVETIPDAQLYKNSMFAFDAVYVVALALDKVIKQDGDEGLMTRYGDEKKAKKIADEMLASDFEGVTGHVSYDRSWNDERLGELILQQFTKYPQHKNDSPYSHTLKSVDVATYYGKEDKLRFHYDPETLFEGGKVTRDRTYDRIRIAKTYPYPVIISLWGIAIAGVIASIILLSINIRYRNIRLIKMSSPNINNGILAGSIICYTCVVLYGIDSRFVDETGIKIACNTVTVALSIGFSLTFGCLFSKTWRIYRIFTAAKTMERVSIKDVHLYAIVIVLVSIDVIVYILWLVISPFSVMQEDDEVKQYGHVIETHFFHKCSCSHQLHFTVALYSYKGLLLIFGLFLAWETRRVKVPVLNDSRHIGLSVYTVCVVSAVGVICASALQNNHNYNTEYIVVSICIIICTSGTLLFVFAPKLYMLFGKVSDVSTSTLKYRTHSGLSSNTASTRNPTSIRRYVDDRTLSTDSQNSESFVDKLSLKFRTAGSDVYTSSRCIRLNSQKHKGYVWNPPPPANKV